METFFRKKHFLEIYIPIGLVIGAFLMLITGFSLAINFVIGIVIAMVGYAIHLKRNKR
jgi:hypothetical protein